MRPACCKYESVPLQWGNLTCRVGCIRGSDTAGGHIAVGVSGEDGSRCGGHGLCMGVGS